MAVATDYTESTGLFLSYGVWALFGAVLLGPMLRDGADARALGYAVASLTVVRMLPVALALLGSGIGGRGTVFIGWFGPRGLASVVFLILAADDLHLTREHVGNLAVQTVLWTIALSVLLHGVSAGPMSAWFARAEASSPRRGAATVGGDRRPAEHAVGSDSSTTTGRERGERGSAVVVASPSRVRARGSASPRRRGGPGPGRLDDDLGAQQVPGPGSACAAAPLSHLDDDRQDSGQPGAREPLLRGERDGQESGLSSDGSCVARNTMPTETSPMASAFAMGGVSPLVGSRRLTSALNVVPSP